MTAAPRWQGIYQLLRARIDRGDYQPGDKLPTERELAEQFDCARSTVGRAFRQLEQAGLVIGRPSAGWRVRLPLDLYFDASKFERVYADDPERGLDQWGQDVTAQGWEPHQIVSVHMLPAARQTARWLGVEIGTSLLRRRRIRRVRKTPDDRWKPVIIADSWFPEDVAYRTVDGRDVPPLMEERDVTLVGGIMRAIGVNQATFVDEIRARMPEDDEVDLLGLLPGTPVLELARVGIDTDGRRIRVIVNVIASDSQYLKYILDVPPRKETTT